MAMYIHEIGRIPAEPHGAAATAPMPLAGPASARSGWFGRNGARWALTATGPTPGPPPPCGMQKVLWRLRCETSAPNQPGLATPTIALRFAPSTYTCPPAAWTRSHSSPCEPAPPLLTDAIEALMTLQRFEISRDDSSRSIRALDQLAREFMALIVNKKTQTTIDSFFLVK